MSTEEVELTLLDFEGVDSNSAPVRWKACFRIEPGSERPSGFARAIYENPTPTHGPRWFDCYDAEQIGHDLESGKAEAWFSPTEINPDVDRVLAIYPDGRGYGWHQYNDKTPERGVMD